MQTWQLGEACNHNGIFSSRFTVYPDILEESGYHVGFTGKGWAPGDWEKGGFKRNPAGNPETGYTNCDSSSTKSLILKQHNNGYDYFFNMAFGKRPKEELFNIVKDPECMNNLAYNPGYTALKEELMRELEKELASTEDPRILGKGDIFDTYEYVGEGKKHSWKAYREGWLERLE